MRDTFSITNTSASWPRQDVCTRTGCASPATTPLFEWGSRAPLKAVQNTTRRVVGDAPIHMTTVEVTVSSLTASKSTTMSVEFVQWGSTHTTASVQRMIRSADHTMRVHVLSVLEDMCWISGKHA